MNEYLKEILPYLVRALDYHITTNMRAIYIRCDGKSNCLITFLLAENPSENDLFLISDVQGMLYGDAIFSEIITELIVNKTSLLHDLVIDGYRIFARNEDE